MDGYSLTEKMRGARRRFRLSATEQALFYELVAICNSEGWQDTFRCSNMELCYALGGIDVKTLIRARLKLINAKLIYYKSAKSKKDVGMYSFDDNFISGIIPPQTPVKTPPQTPVKTPNLIKTKIETKSKKERGKEKFLPPSILEVKNYFMDEKSITAEEAQYRASQFYDFYDSKNWMVGKNKMSNWKSAATRSLAWEDKRKKAYTHPAASYKPDYTQKIDERF